MSVPKKLIEVAMPIKEISAESVRDKSIRNGHISTLHLWWARRPLPVCRAVVFASLVPDPLDEACPKIFKQAVELLLGPKNNPGDPYKPYEDIPYTAAVDSMDDNLRHRLMMFIGKFSNQFILAEKAGKATPTAKIISDHSLIKWENRDNEKVLEKAKKLIWVAYNSNLDCSLEQLLKTFDDKTKAIKNAEYSLYNSIDRHKLNEDVKEKQKLLQNAITEFLNQMPKVFDPFAGGGAIPLEASRLGCRTYGNDINPVAHIIQKGTLEFPQKFGKPIKISRTQFISQYGEKEYNKIPAQNKILKNGEAVAVALTNRLSFDINFYCRELISQVERDYAFFYPKKKDGAVPIIYYWARIGNCTNPTCKAEVPLLRQFYLSKRRNYTEKDWHYLKPIIDGNSISFEVKRGKSTEPAWNTEGNIKCPCCGSVTKVNEIKDQFNKYGIKEKLLAIIYEDKDGNRTYESANSINLPNESILERPQELMPTNDSQNVKVPFWGIKKYGDLFNNRQIAIVNSFIKYQQILFQEQLSSLDENYAKCLQTYIAIFIDKIITRYTNISVWHVLQETVEHPFGNKSIPMVFDYPEMNPFSSLSGSAYGQIEPIIKVVEAEGTNFNFSNCVNTSSGTHQQFGNKEIDSVITDPPYYDSIAYADLSDFYYVWLKRSIGNIYPYNFSTPLTPKTDECTAIKAHFDGNKNEAVQHFERKLLEILSLIERQTKDIVSIMFAHQSTEAWTTLCNSILGAKMNITGSWAVDTEQTVALKSNKAFLSSSVTVTCKPSLKTGYGTFKEVKKAIETTIEKEVDELFRMGFRGADLLTACFGQAVSEFGKYEKVEKSDGSEVTVLDLLKMARESAFNALLKGFAGDDFTKFYIGWLQLYGFAESDFDDAAKLSRVGLSINVADLFTEHILIKNGNKQTLGNFEDRLRMNKYLGEKPNSFLIDHVHKAMALYKGTNRIALLQYIDKVASSPESSFWRVITSLCEVLPAGSEDHKQGIGLLTNKDSLIRESKTIQVPTTEQTKLFE